MWSLLDRVGQGCIRKLTEASQSYGKHKNGKQHFSMASAGILTFTPLSDEL